MSARSAADSSMVLGDQPRSTVGVGRELSQPLAQVGQPAQSPLGSGALDHEVPGEPAPLARLVPRQPLIDRPSQVVTTSPCSPARAAASTHPVASG
ncbi:MAG TPA: hypothetical protein VIT41_08020 [Microlunatus sp.]